MKFFALATAWLFLFNPSISNAKKDSLDKTAKKIIGEYNFTFQEISNKTQYHGSLSIDDVYLTDDSHSGHKIYALVGSFDGITFTKSELVLYKKSEMGILHADMHVKIKSRELTVGFGFSNISDLVLVKNAALIKSATYPHPAAQAIATKKIKLTSQLTALSGVMVAMFSVNPPYYQQLKLDGHGSTWLDFDNVSDVPWDGQKIKVYGSWNNDKTVFIVDQWRALGPPPQSK